MEEAELETGGAVAFVEVDGGVAVDFAVRADGGRHGDVCHIADEAAATGAPVGLAGCLCHDDDDDDDVMLSFI